ncbi:hypothetical protein KBK24_0119170 [Burkholderia sp. K24]|nr:hypothetical protein KBK24_0119170 [Burkholderia sp. K24]
MRREAELKLRDAEVLRQHLDPEDCSTSAYMLQLLALELLLKLACHHLDIDPKIIRRAGHEYDSLFRLLPDATQRTLLENAGARIGRSALSAEDTGADQVLRHWAHNFSALRYPYESYPNISALEYDEVGADWLTSGAKSKDATFVFYPEELLGLTSALLQLTAPAD